MERDQPAAELLALYQTILLPTRSLAPVTLLTVPKREVGEEDQPLAEIVADVLSAPTSLVTSQDWLEVRQRLDQAEAWAQVGSAAPPQLQEQWQTDVNALQQALPRTSGQFVRLAFEALLVAPGGYGHPLSPPLATLYGQIYRRRRDLELSEERWATWIQVAAALAQSRPPGFENLMDKVLETEVSFALSPLNTRDVKAFLADPRTVVFGPLVAGAGAAVPLIAAGTLVLAWEVALTGAAMTIVFAGTYWLGERILAQIPPHRRR